MLPIFPVLLLATSALAAPSVKLNLRDYNEIAPPKNNGQLSFATSSAFGIVDGGETNTYTLTVQQIVNDLASLPDPSSQALVLGQTVAMLSQLATGVPGDACAAANLIDAHERSVRTGNNAGVRQAVANFVEGLARSVDQIVELANNPQSVRYAVGPRGNCAGGGRSYAFEAAWDSVRANTSPAQAEYINDQYCIAKRLFNGVQVQSNNVAAYLTAASLPPVVQAVEGAIQPLSRFLGALAGGNPGTYAGAAKQALVNAI